MLQQLQLTSPKKAHGLKGYKQPLMRRQAISAGRKGWSPTDATKTKMSSSAKIRWQRHREQIKSTLANVRRMNADA